MRAWTSLLFKGLCIALVAPLGGCALIAGLEERSAPPARELRTLAEGHEQPRGLAIDPEHGDGYIYWADKPVNVPEDNGIWRVPVEGGKAEHIVLLDESREVKALLVDEPSIYWFDVHETCGEGDADRLLKAPTTGADASELPALWTSCEGPLEAAQNGTAVYWTVSNNSKILEFNKGTQVARALSIHQHGVEGITADTTHVYWAMTSQVARYDLKVNQRKDWATAAEPRGIVNDETSVFWFTHGGDVVRSSKTKASDTETLTTGLADPGGIAVSGDWVYVTEAGRQRVVRMPKRGATPSKQLDVVATNQGYPSRIVADGQYVYWTNYEAGTVMRWTIP